MGIQIAMLRESGAELHAVDKLALGTPAVLRLRKSFLRWDRVREVMVVNSGNLQ